MASFRRASLYFISTCLILASLTASPAQAATVTFPCDAGYYEVMDGTAINGRTCGGIITLDSSVLEIGTEAFSGTEITSLTIPSSVTRIGTRAFYSTSSLVSVVIGENVLDIGDSAFNSDPNLTTVTFLGTTLNTLGSEAFAGTQVLQSLSLPSGLTVLNHGIVNSSGISSFTIPSTVTTIANDAFQSSDISSLDIPETVTSIADEPFPSYPGSIPVTLHMSTNKSYEYRFLQCGNSDPCDSYGQNLAYLLSDGLLPPGLSFDASTGIISGTPIYNGTFTPTFTIIYANEMAMDVSSFTFVITDSQESAPCYTISGSELVDGSACSGSLHIEDFITRIRNYAFQNGSITDVSFGSGSQLTFIGDGAFTDSTITSINIPSTVTSIDGAFFYTGNLETVTFETGSVLTTIGSQTFSNSGLQTIVLPPSLIGVGGNAFRRSAIRNVTLPDGLLRIGGGAFAEDTNLREITIPASVTSIGGAAFSQSTLSVLHLPGGVIPLRDNELAFDVIDLGAGGFYDWNTDSAGIGISYEQVLNSGDVSYSITASTLFAVWTHTVTFKANGGTGADEIQRSNSSTTLSALSSLGIANGDSFFEGWTTGGDGSGDAYIDGDTYSFTADINLFAQWGSTPPPPPPPPPPVNYYHVTYAGLDGISGTPPTQADVAEGGSFTVAPSPTRPGYIFTNWTDGAGNAYGGADYMFSTYNVGSSNVTLTANWESISHPIVRYLAQNNAVPGEIDGYFGDSRHAGMDIAPGWCVIGGFDALGAAVNPATWVVYQKSGSRNWESAAISDPSATFKIGDTFQFSPDPSIAITTGENQAVRVGQSVTSTALLNSACTANKYSITPVLPGGLQFDTSTGTVSGTPTESMASTTFTIEASRWVDGSGNLDLQGVKIGFDTATISLEVIPTYAVTYQRGSRGTGSAPISSSTYISGGTFAVASGASLTHTAGYHFATWNDGSANFNSGDTYTVGSANIVLTAQWETNTRYTVNFNSLGGSLVDTATFIYETSFSAPTPPVRDGFTFTGWSLTESGAAIHFPYTPITAGDLTLYAQWSENSSGSLTQATLRIISPFSTVAIGRNVAILTQGGSGRGAITLSVTGAGCSVGRFFLYSNSQTICTVVATRAGTGNFLPATSAPFVFTFLPAAPAPQFTAFTKVSSTLITFAITNFDPSFNFQITSNFGRVQLESRLGSVQPITVTGLSIAASRGLNVTVVVSKSGYATTTARLSGYSCTVSRFPFCYWSYSGD